MLRGWMQFLASLDRTEEVRKRRMDVIEQSPASRALCTMVPETSFR
jgi:hypothetical protein